METVQSVQDYIHRYSYAYSIFSRPPEHHQPWQPQDHGIMEVNFDASIYKDKSGACSGYQLLYLILETEKVTILSLARKLHKDQRLNVMYYSCKNDNVGIRFPKEIVRTSLCKLKIHLYPWLQQVILLKRINLIFLLLILLILDSLEDVVTI